MADGIPPPPPGFNLDPQPVYGAAPKPPSPPPGYAPIDKPVTPVTYIPGGPDDPTRVKPDPGYHLNPDNSEAPNRGGPHDPTNPENALTPDALNDTTSKLILTGQMDPMGMGGGPVRLQILNNRPVMLQKYGITDQQLPSIQAQFKADSQAYAQRVQQLSFVQQATDAANQHIHQISGYLQQLPAQTDARALNAVSNFAQRQMSGDTITQLDATIPLLQSEIAKIMTANPSGAAQLTDDARHEFDILQSNASPHSKMLALQALQQMGQGKINGLRTEIDGLHGRLTGGLQTYAQLAHSGILGGTGNPPPPPSGGVPPDVTPPTGGTSNAYDAQGSAFVDNMVRQGVPYDQAVNQWQRFNQSRGLQVQMPFGPDEYNAAVVFAKANPKADYHPTQAIISKPISPTEQAISQAAESAPGVATGSAVNAAAGGIPVALAGDKGQFYQDVAQAQHPDAQLAGTIIGGTAGALAGEAVLARAGMASGFGRSLLADTGYGAVSGATSNPQNALSGAVVGGVAGAGGSIAGQGLVRGTAAALRGVSGRDVNALADVGVPLTVGQTASQSGRVGQVVKGVEDRLSGFSGVGDMIQSRRMEGLKAFNSKAFDQALSPIGGSVNGAVGEEAVQKASRAVSGAFSSALKGKVAVPDQEFISAARGPLERLVRNQRVGPEIVDAIEGATEGLFDNKTGALTGEHMQAFLNGLRQIRDGYKNDPLYQTLIKPSIQGVEGAVEGMFRRQAPEVMPEFNRAKAAYRKLSTLSDAVNSGVNANGMFTPAQLGQAARGNAKRFNGSIAAASGTRPFADIQRAAQNVLPSKVPDSGTAGRIALAAGSLPAAGAGIGYLGGDTKGGAETGLGLTALLAALYSRGGQAGLSKLLLSRSPRARAIAQQMLARAPIAGAAGTALTQTGGPR